MIARGLRSVGFSVLSFFLAATASAQHSRLSPELLSRLLALLPAKGTDQDIPPSLASILGYPEDRGLPVRQLASMDKNGNFHAFGFNRVVDDQDLEIVLLIPKKNFRAFRIHRDGTLVAAAMQDPQTMNFKMLLNADQAQKELNAELAYWQLVFRTGE